MAYEGRTLDKKMPDQNEQTDTQADALGKNKVDGKPASETQMGEEEGDDGIEQTRQGEGVEEPLFVESEFHKSFSITWIGMDQSTNSQCRRFFSPSLP